MNFVILCFCCLTLLWLSFCVSLMAHEKVISHFFTCVKKVIIYELFVSSSINNRLDHRLPSLTYFYVFDNLMLIEPKIIATIFHLLIDIFISIR